MNEKPREGLYINLPEKDYHADPAFSRSFAWTAYSKTWRHAIGQVYKEQQHFNFGSAFHKAILLPNDFELTVARGPIDRRGSKWKQAKNEATDNAQLLLTSTDYDSVLKIRDTVHSDNGINTLIVNDHSIAESSAFWIDKETGERCKVRPDLVRPDIGIMVDLKTSMSAAQRDFQRSIAKYGYAMQDAAYMHGWSRACGSELTGFVFLVVEKEPPYEFAIYELDENSVYEGWLQWRKTLDEFHKYKENGLFPGYDREVRKISLPSWSFRESIGY